MLILTRNISASIMIGDDVKVTVLGIKGQQVRIGINAPQAVEVHREEIYEKVQVEKKEAEEARNLTPNFQKAKRAILTMNKGAKTA